MSARARKVIEDALALPKDELVRVVAELQDLVEQIDSPNDVDAAWQDEIVDRLRGIKGGSAVLYEGSQVDAALCRLLEEEA